MSKLEQRGRKRLEAATKPPRALKHPVTTYVHYTSMAGEFLAFAVIGTTGLRGKLKDGAERSNTVPYKAADRLEVTARLVELPSQTP